MPTPSQSSKDLRPHRLNVLCVTPRGLDGKGGIDRLFRYLATNQSYVDAGNVKVRFFTSRGDARGPGWLALFPLRILLYTIHLLFRPVDIVHLNLSINASAYRKYILMSIARLMGKKVIVHFHGGGFEHMLCDRKLSVRFILKILQKADQSIVLGHFWHRLLGASAGLSADTIHVIYNAVPDIGGLAALSRKPASTLRLIFAGELHHRKGIDVLLETLSALNRRYQNWTCIIAGNGPAEAYKADAQRLAIAQQTQFVGWISAERLHTLMLASDIVILPSRGEGLPMCLVEATATGAAMVATDEGATREVLQDGINGLIVPLNSDAIADALYSLAQEPDKLAAMQSASRAIYLEKFGIDRMIRDLHALYVKAAQDHRP